MKDFRKGDILRRRLYGGAWHYGVCLGEIRGQIHVFELTAEDGERAICRIVPAEDFAEGQACERAASADAAGPTDFAAMGERAQALLRQCRDTYVPYSLSGGGCWNCEEAARYVVTGERISYQALAERKTHGHQQWGMALAVAGVAALAVAGIVVLFGQKKYHEEHARLEGRDRKRLPKPDSRS